MPSPDNEQYEEATEEVYEEGYEYDYDEPKKKFPWKTICTLIVLAGLGVGGYFAYKGGLFDKIFKKESTTSGSVSAVSESAEAPEDTLKTEVAKPAEPAKPAIPERYEFPYYEGNSIGEEMANLISEDGFAGTVDGMSLQQFQGWHVSRTSNLLQAKRDDNGYLYQFFFNLDGQLSGIALSHYADNPWYECETIDQAVGTSDSERMITMPNGALVSPGYTRDKVYIYYFYQCAPDPNPAPRR